MKVLSLLQPWASLVVLGHKKIETRSWNTKHRGELLIHASKKKVRVDKNTRQLLDHLCEIPGFMENYDQLPYGAIIGKVNLVETFQMDEEGCRWMKDSNSDNEKEFHLGDWRPSRYGWLLSDPLNFHTPIPCKGKLSIWDLLIGLEPLVIDQIIIS